jgi:hypothetical protein
MAIVVIAAFAYYWIFQVPANFRSKLTRLSDEMEERFEKGDFHGARLKNSEINDMLKATPDEFK